MYIFLESARQGAADELIKNPKSWGGGGESTHPPWFFALWTSHGHENYVVVS